MHIAEIRRKTKLPCPKILWGVVAERLESSTANPSMRVRAPIEADFSAHCEIKQSLNHFACSQVTGT